MPNSFDEGPMDSRMLPCGARGHADACGFRCDECFAIWGSVACRCSREAELLATVKKDDRQADKEGV
jgi:hypothetical protein